MKMSGVLVEKVPKSYFVGVAWTLFTPLRDIISVSNNRIITEINVPCLRNITTISVIFFKVMTFETPKGTTAVLLGFKTPSSTNSQISPLKGTTSTSVTFKGDYPPRGLLPT